MENKSFWSKLTHDRGVILYCRGHSYKAQQNLEVGLRENVPPKVSLGKEMSQSISEGTSKDSVNISSHLYKTLPVGYETVPVDLFLFEAALAE